MLRLSAVVLYGRHAVGPVAPGAPAHTLVVVRELGLGDLEACARRVPTWRRAHLAVPLIVVADEFERSLDAFPAEFGAILSGYRVLHDCARRPVQRAGIEWLVLTGIAATVTLVVVHNGLLIANGRDGASQLLGYLEPARHLVRDAPSFVGFQDHVSVPWIVSAIWIAIAAIA